MVKSSVSRGLSGPPWLTDLEGDGDVEILLGTLVPVLVTHFGKLPTVITPQSLVLAFGISAAVGITFGLYPAYRAAHMDPIESLRHE